MDPNTPKKRAKPPGKKPTGELPLTRLRNRPTPADPSRIAAEVAAIARVEAPPPPANAVRRWTIAEVRMHVREVESCLVDGMRPKQIQAILRDRHGLAPARVLKLIDRVKQDWSSIATDEQRIVDREAAIRRIQRMRMAASGIVDSKNAGRWIVPPNHSAVAKYETLLMDLQGTREAVKVDVDVRYTQAMVSLMAGMSGEEGADLLAEALEQKALADLARSELPPMLVEARMGNVVPEAGNGPFPDADTASPTKQ